MAEWQLQEVKNKLSHVIEKALHEGPQFVTRRGKRSVVIVSINEFEKSLCSRPDLKTFLLNAPHEELEIHRSNDSVRDIEI